MFEIVAVTMRSRVGDQPRGRLLAFQIIDNPGSVPGFPLVFPGGVGDGGEPYLNRY